MAALITARALVKTYDTDGVRVEALRGIDLEVEKGQMVAIMGPSGCGKATLLNTLSGIDDITAGEVIIDGAAIHPHMNQEGKTFHEFAEIFMTKPDGPDRVEKLSEYARKRDKTPKHRLLEKHPELEGQVE